MDTFDLDNILPFLRGKARSESRFPYSLWKHFPGRDLLAKDLLKAHVEFQNLVQSDIIKISPHSKFSLVDFGVEFDPKEYNEETGSYITKKYPIQKLKDWEKIDEFDPQTGELGKQIDLVKLMAKEFPNTPKMMTIFLPLMVARKLVKDDKLLEHYKEDQKLVKDRIKAITNVISDFATICIEDGTEGLFLATQEANRSDGWTTELWSNLAYPFDKQVVEATSKKSNFQVLHLHGDDIFFKEILKKIVVTAINFHSFQNFPGFFTSKDLLTYFNGGLLGGFEDKVFLDTMDKKSLDSYYDSLIETVEPISSRMIFSPNCVIPQNSMNDRLRDIITKIRQ